MILSPIWVDRYLSFFLTSSDALCWSAVLFASVGFASSRYIFVIKGEGVYSFLYNSSRSKSSKRPASSSAIIFSLAQVSSGISTTKSVCTQV
ncbi:hypothetical protein ES703_56436 [subsurface metagenome]